MKTCLATVVLLLTIASSAMAQSTIPQPTSPVVVCGTQASPNATSFKMSFDTGTPEDLTMITPAQPDGSGNVVSFCNAQAPGWTHAFTIPAARFVLRTQPYPIVVHSLNQFGETVGTPWNVSIGMKPGSFTIIAVGQLPS